jgi:hypothetical protein
VFVSCGEDNAFADYLSHLAALLGRTEVSGRVGDLAKLGPVRTTGAESNEQAACATQGGVIPAVVSGA